jgi:hypothetical protein
MLSQSSISPKFRGLLIRVLQVSLILVLVGAGWLIYRQLPDGTADVSSNQGTATLQIFIRQTPETVGPALDVAVSLYPVDIVAVRHEFFTNARLDKQGEGAVTLAPGSWWLHATLSGDEQLEWRLPVTVTGSKQVIELTPKNAYTRSKTF